MYDLYLKTGICSKSKDIPKGLNVKNSYQNRVVKSLTLCGAAICDVFTGLPKIVVCADKLFTNQTGNVYESGMSKIRILSSNCYVMLSSNNLLMSDVIIDRTRSKIKDNLNVGVTTMANMFAAECENMYKESSQKNVLAKYGLSQETFHAKELAPELANQITKDLSAYHDNYILMGFLIVGFERNGDTAPIPKMFSVDQFGNLTMHGLDGFVFIGSGSPIAEYEFTKSPYQMKASLGEAVTRLYDAKKLAERNAFVGPSTDFLVMQWPKEHERAEMLILSLEIKHMLNQLLNKKDKISISSTQSIYEEIHGFIHGKGLERITPT